MPDAQTGFCFPQARPISRCSLFGQQVFVFIRLTTEYTIAVVYVVTCNPALPAIVIAALKITAVSHSPNGAAFIEKIVRDPIKKESCVIIAWPRSRMASA